MNSKLKLLLRWKSDLNVQKCLIISEVLLLFRAAVRFRPVYHLEMTPISRISERMVIPRAPVRARPLQHLEVPSQRRF